MEETSSVRDELRLFELKRMNLRKSFDQAHAQASGIFMFTLQWKDLENHHNSIKTELEKRSQQVELKEKDLVTSKVMLEERAREIELAETNLGFLRTKVGECSKELELKERELGLLQKRVEGCNSEFRLKEGELNEVRKLIEDCSEELSLKRTELVSMRKSMRELHSKLELKREELGFAQNELERCRRELCVENEHLGRVQKGVQEYKDEIGIKEKEMSLLLEKLFESCNQIDAKEKQLGSLQKLLEERSSELVSNEKDLDTVRGLLKDCNRDLELKEKKVQLQNISIKDCCCELDSKRKELDEIQMLIEEQTEELEKKLKHHDSIKLLILEYGEELNAKEIQYHAMMESIKTCSLELESKAKKLQLTEESVQKFSGTLHSEEKKLDSFCRHLKRCTSEFESKEKELNSVKKTVKEYCKELELKQREYNALNTCLEEHRQEIESKQNNLKSLESSVEEISNSLKVKQEDLSSIQKSVVQCSEELEMKRKQLDLIETSIKEKSELLASKERELDLIRKKTCESLKELEVKEEHYNLLEKSLDERAEELKVKSMEFELKERTLDGRIKEFELKEHLIESSRKNVEKCIEDLESKAKQLSNFCQRGRIEQTGNITCDRCMRSTSESIQLYDGESLQLLLNVVHNKISDALETSSDPAQLVLDAMQGFYPPHLRIGEMEFDESVARKSCISLLEDLMVMSPPIKPQVQEEAMKLANKWKANISAKSENSKEVLGFLHLLAAFNLAFAFNTNELQSLLDIFSHLKHAPCLCRALGLSAKAPVSNAPASGVKLEQPDPVHVNNAIISFSPSANVQNNSAIVNQGSQLPPNEHDLMKNEISASLVHDEVLDSLRLMPAPAKFVLELLQGALYGNRQPGEMGLEENFVKNCVMLLEGVMHFPQQIKPKLKSEALKLAVEWRRKMVPQTRNPLMVLGFLQLLATYGVGNSFNRDDIFRLFFVIAHHRHAPKLFEALGFTSVVPDFIANLTRREQYVAAARFICSFNLTNRVQPVALLKIEMENFKRSAAVMHKGKNLLESQAEGIAAMRAILELIMDYKLEMDLPADLVVKFMLQLGNQNHSIGS